MGLGDGRSVVTPLDHALDQLVTARDHLVKLVDDGALTGLDHVQLVGVLQSFERFRNGLPVVDHRLIVDSTARGLPEVLAQPSMRQVLVQPAAAVPGGSRPAGRCRGSLW